jgi:hypothetical protein
LLAGGALRCDAATIVAYPFDVNYNASIVAPGVNQNLNFDNIPSGTGVYDDGFGNVLQAYPNADSTTAALALTNNSFFAMTLSIPGGSFGPVQVSYEVGKGGDSDPRGYFVRSDLDGYLTNLMDEVLPSGEFQAPSLRSFNLDLTGLESITLRFYIYTPIPGDNSVDFRNLTVSGTYVEPPPIESGVPEPGTWALSGLGLAAVAAWRRRRS